MPAFEEASGTLPNAVWIAPGRQHGVQDGQHGSQDGQLGPQDDPNWRPETVFSLLHQEQEATRNDPERPEAAEIDFSAIF